MSNAFQVSTSPIRTLRGMASGASPQPGGGWEGGHALLRGEEGRLRLSPGPGSWMTSGLHTAPSGGDRVAPESGKAPDL